MCVDMGGGGFTLSGKGGSRKEGFTKRGFTKRVVHAYLPTLRFLDGVSVFFTKMSVRGD